MDSVVRLFLLGCHGFRNEGVLKDRASTLESRVSILSFSSGVEGFCPLRELCQSTVCTGPNLGKTLPGNKEPKKVKARLF